MTTNPASKVEMLAACQRLHAESVTLRALSTRWLRAEMRPAFRAGATPADVLYALDHHPDGTPWRHTEQVRRVAGWIRYRLAAWRTETGAFCIWPSQRAAQARQQLRAAQQARRETEQATRRRAQAVDPARIRELTTAQRARLLEQRARRRHITGAASSNEAHTRRVHTEQAGDFEAHRQAQAAALQAWADGHAS